MTAKAAKRPVKPKVRPTDPRQGNLFYQMAREEGPEMVPLPSEIVSEVRGFSEDQRVRAMLTVAFRASGHSREELAAAMSAGDETVTTAMLHTWTGPSRTNAAPIKVLKALLLAIGPKAAMELLNELLAGSGYIALDQEWAVFARIGQAVVMKAKLDERIQEAMAAGRLAWRRS